MRWRFYNFVLPCCWKNQSQSFIMLLRNYLLIWQSFKELHSKAFKRLFWSWKCIQESAYDLVKKDGFNMHFFWLRTPIFFSDTARLYFVSHPPVCSVPCSFLIFSTFEFYFQIQDLMGMHSFYTVKKVINFPVLRRDVTNQTLPGRESLNYSRPGEFGLWHPGWGRGNC